MRSQTDARKRAVQAKNCEPEIRDHVAMRMRKRAENMKREAKAAGRSLNIARATSPHYTTIQNVRFSLFEQANHGLPVRSRPV